MLEAFPSTSRDVTSMRRLAEARQAIQTLDAATQVIVVSTTQTNTRRTNQSRYNVRDLQVTSIQLPMGPSSSAGLHSSKEAQEEAEQVSALLLLPAVPAQVCY